MNGAKNRNSIDLVHPVRFLSLCSLCFLCLCGESFLAFSRWHHIEQRAVVGVQINADGMTDLVGGYRKQIV